MSKNKFSASFSGKGYYIALILCAVAIGITGYLYYRNAGSETQQLQSPTAQADATLEDPNVQAIATEGKTDDKENNTTEPSATQPPVTGKKPGKTAKPVSGETVAPYSMDALHYNQTTRDWRVHDGMDIAAAAGTEVCAAADGTVYTVYEDETMGMTVVISHEGGYTTKYSSLAAEVAVKAGDTVTAGQVIGCVGNTALLESAMGDHVHFSVSCGGEAVDPAEFLS